MVIESPFDDLYTITTTGQQQDGSSGQQQDGSSSSSSQQQLTLYDHSLCDALFLSQSTNESNMQFSSIVTIPGMYNLSSNLGQNHLQIAAEASPDDQRIRSNNALHHINRILMEDIDERVGSHEGEAALQAAEKAFYDILEQVYSPSLNWSPLHNISEAIEGPDEGSSNYHKRPRITSFTSEISSHNMLQSLPAPLGTYDNGRSLFLPYQPLASTESASRFGSPAFQFQMRREAEDGKGFDKMVICLDNDRLLICRLATTKAKEVAGKSKYAIFQITDHMNNPYILDSDTREGRSKNYTITCEISRNEMFDRVVLCYGLDCFIETSRLREMAAKERSENSPKGQSKAPARQKLRGTRQLKKEVVDLRTLLMHCAQAVAADDRLLAGELIKKIRQHSSRDGECCQRLAFYFVNGLEARLAGTGSKLFHKMLAKRISDEDVLRVYNFYLTVCPFLRASYTFANETILEASVGQSKVHIVDFGVCHGFQWPSLIQLFGEQGVPPRLRITGIEVSRPGFSPLENIERAGKLLGDYANMYKVPFQYQGIYSQYEDIQIEDLNIEEDEVLIINCMYRMRYLGDETVAMHSARDRVLNIMRKMNPKVFIFGILNGSYSSPFFVTRFKELLFHYSSIFDMLDTNAPRNNEERKLLEGGMLGREILNIIACEGADRIEKPETYQQWQARCAKAGFEQLPPDPAIMKQVLLMKKEFYHEDFVADEDNGWLLQGWKGRVLFALSKWKVNESYAGQ